MSDIRRSLPRTCIAAGLIALSLITVHSQAPRDGSGVSRGDPIGTPTQGSRITRQQRERLEARIAAATAIIDRLESDARAQGLASGWRQAAFEVVLPLSLNAMQRIERQALSLDSLAGAARLGTQTDLASPAPRTTADEPAALGDSDLDLVYMPISPCRYIDTRSAGGKVNGVREFDFDLSASVYGGTPVCDASRFTGSADDIGALAMNVTIVDTSTAATPGFVAVKPTANAPTTSLLNWYDQGPGVQVANQGIVSLFQSVPDNHEFVIQTSGAVHIVVDIFGAFVAPQATALQTVQLLDFVGVPTFGDGCVESPPCPGGYTLTGGGCYTEHLHFLHTSYPGTNDDRWACCSGNVTAGTQFLFARAICSRVPGR